VAFGWTLRMIGSQWMKTFVSPNASKEEDQKPLLHVENCEEGCTSYLEDSNDHRGREKLLGSVDVGVYYSFVTARRTLAIPSPVLTHVARPPASPIYYNTQYHMCNTLCMYALM